MISALWVDVYVYYFFGGGYYCVSNILVLFINDPKIDESLKITFLNVREVFGGIIFYNCCWWKNFSYKKELGYNWLNSIEKILMLQENFEEEVYGFLFVIIVES